MYYYYSYKDGNVYLNQFYTSNHERRSVCRGAAGIAQPPVRRYFGTLKFSPSKAQIFGQPLGAASRGLLVPSHLATPFSQFLHPG
jgi:hypothetical protein